LIFEIVKIVFETMIVIPLEFFKVIFPEVFHPSSTLVVIA